MKKIVQVFTVSLSTIFIEGLADELKQAGYDLSVISADGPEARKAEAAGEYSFWPVEMARGLSPIQNLKSWIKVRKILKEIRPDIVHGNTPIGGLISMTAALSLGIRNRVYTMHGLKYPGEKGIRRGIIKSLEKATVMFSTKAFAVSNGLKDYAIQEKIASPKKLTVINHGSVKGIDIEKSRRIRERGRIFYEKKYGLSNDVFRIGYFGRINEEKGVPELIKALDEILKRHTGLDIILCGSEEMSKEKNKKEFDLFTQDKNVHFFGWVTDPLEYMICCDCIVLPTHREGFGLVNIEANSVGVPVITTDVMGCKDTIEDGVTGFFFSVGDMNALIEKLEFLINNGDIGKRMAQAGIDRAEEMFNRQDIWSALINNYDMLTREG